MDSERIFTTRDWIIVSLCLAKGIRLKNVIRNGDCYFVLDEYDRANGLMEAFNRGELEVNALKFVESQRHVKNLIHKGSHQYGNELPTRNNSHKNRSSIQD